MDENAELPEELLSLGSRVGELERPAPPEGLAARTAALAVSDASWRKTPARGWWRRPIHSPCARIAALLMFLLTLGLLSNLDIAERTGRFFEALLGERAVDRFQVVVDKFLVAYEPSDISDEEAARILGAEFPRPGLFPCRGRSRRLSGSGSGAV